MGQQKEPRDQWWNFTSCESFRNSHKNLFLINKKLYTYYVPTTILGAEDTKNKSFPFHETDRYLNKWWQYR